MSGRTFVTPWYEFGDYGRTHYRIWMRETSDGREQHHEWRFGDGHTEHDDWFPTTVKRWPTATEVSA